MSECDEGWTYQEPTICPAYKYDHCGLGMGCEYEGDQPWEPDTCPYAPILKLLAEAKEVDHLYINKSPDQLGKGGERVSFWIRR